MKMQISRYLAEVIMLIGVSSIVGAGAASGRAPLYWSVYENQVLKEEAGQRDTYVDEAVWRAHIDWVDENLKDLGYTMVCIDGWGDCSVLSEHGYRLTHSRLWEHDFAWWAAHLGARGMSLGMYGNPLWVHVPMSDTNTLIVGTDIPVVSLVDPAEEARFPWVQVDRPGAEEYVKGWIHFYADMGVRYYRIDFLSWFEDGWDRYLGRAGPERPREHYLTALRWMREAADEQGMFLSLVMPHLYHDAEAERQYGHMIRINEDTGKGEWHKWGEKDRGERRKGWSVYANPIDGLTYWSTIAGREGIILDPDFIRLNTFANDEEKMSVISLCLLAGAPVTAADQMHTIGNDLWLYVNHEMLALNHDGFAGHPLTNEPTEAASQVWTGQMKNGDWVVGLFNREATPQVREIDFETLGLEGPATVRDLWRHENLGQMRSFSEELPPRSCRILRLFPEGSDSLPPDAPTAMRVEQLDVAEVMATEDTRRGRATVRVVDTSGQGVAHARVQVAFGGSFDEEVTGLTDANGRAELATSAALPAPLRIRASVTHVSHPELTYLAHLNETTCEGPSRYVAGTFNNWKPRTMHYRDGRWRLDGVLIGEGQQRLKFTDSPDFSGDDWGDASGLAGTVTRTTGDKTDVVFHAPSRTLYTIAFDDETLEYAIQPTGIGPITGAVTLRPEKPVAGGVMTIIYDAKGRDLRGAEQVFLHLGRNGWQDIASPAPAMTRLAENLWSIEFPILPDTCEINFVFHNGLDTWDKNEEDDWMVPVAQSME